ncbi:arabinosyltransferase domain-containing protein [Actinomycetospora sp. CA-084318]|uniref:arabinosyltransferase domain-containing protein n=1 Tax=Actinomycetospora sp. CA-084318 TaxID=3239892 RepID=UPI003D95475E
MAALVALVSGIAAVVVALAVPGAPVESSTSTVTWPRPGAAPVPTTLFLVPYRPAALQVTVPCDAVRAARARTAETTVVATTVGAPGEALAVRTRPGAGDGPTVLQVISAGRVVPVEVPDEDCGLTIVADGAGLTVTVGDRVAATVPGDPVPEVFAATTDLTGRDATGLALTARTPAWFDNAPAADKSALLTAQPQLALVGLLLVVVAGALAPAGPSRTLRELASVRGLALARTTWRRSRRRVRAAARRALARPRVLARLAVDAAVALGLSWWSIVGPLTDDDGFAAVIARQIGDGDVGNYYRWSNASEVPFATNQRLLATVLDDGIGPLALRTPSVLAGLLTWVVLTRGVLRPALGPAGRSLAVRVLAAVAFAVWWLPYDLGARPEPLVALGTVVVTALVLRAVRPAAGRPVVLIAVAALAAGLTVTVAPSGLMTAAPVLLCLPRVLRALGPGPREDGTLARVTRVVLPAAHVAVVAGLAAVALVVVFAQQSWHGFEVATEIHRQIGPNQPWYAEWLRYGYLFGEDSWGAAAKRVPVVVGLVLAGTGLVLLARGSGGERTGTGVGVLGRESVLLLGLLPTGFGLLAVTPSKWSHHYGALAGFGAIGIVAAVVALGRASRRRDPVVAATAGVATLLLALGAAFAFAGPNAWWAYSGFGMPGSTGPQRPFDAVAVWILVAAVAAAPAVVVVRRRRVPDDGPPLLAAVLAAAPLVPAATAVVVVTVSVLLLGSTFAAAADRGDRWSLAAQTRAELAGAPGACGLQDRVEVLRTVPAGPLTPVRGSTATMSGFVADGGAVDPPPLRPDQTDGTDGTTDTRDGRFTWGSRADGDGSVGEMTTAWFGLTRPTPDQELAVGVAGRTADGASLTWEFGRGDRVVGERAVVEDPEPDRGYRGYAGSAEQERRQDDAARRDRWRTVTLPAGDVPAEADRVRLRATDDRTDTGGWIAFTGPRVVEPEPLDRWLADRGPVLVDWAVAFAWPCAGELPRVTGGVAQTPGVVVTAPTAPYDPVPGERTTNPSPPGDIVPERWTGGTDGLFTGQDSGGSFAGLVAVGSLRELDTRLPDEPARRWGRVLVPDLGDLETDRYLVTRDTRTLPGTAGDPPPEVR